jgi:Leucine-rich repeat (LRR) protein
MEINCSNKNYTTFESIRRTFSNTKSISKLNISSNKIKFLPSNMSSFVNLSYLDLRGNPLHNYNSIIEGLKSLPKLQVLWIDIIKPTEDDINIRHLLDNLPKLHSLNGQDINHLKLKFMKESGYKSKISILTII